MMLYLYLYPARRGCPGNVMRSLKLSYALCALLIIAATATSGAGYSSQATPPQETPVLFNNPAKLDTIMAPYVQMARRSYPDAKARFQKGLPSRERFLITTRIFDPQGNFQQVFVEVNDISNGKVAGRVVTGTKKSSGTSPADVFICNETDILDWAILKPDGTLEGNVVGKYLGVLQERYVGLVLELVIGRDGAVMGAKCLRAQNRAEQDVTFCVPDSVMRRAEVIARTLRYDPADSVVTKYTFLVYDYQEGRVQEPEKTSKSGK